jgi:hypothetical protein
MAPLRICQRVVERHRHQVGRITAAEANHSPARTLIQP